MKFSLPFNELSSFMMKALLDIKCHARIFLKDEPFLGKGPVSLLENIIRFGSIAKAAKAMKMSYRKAWQLVQNMNRQAGEPLVIKRLGGRQGGGAEVTPAGREAIQQYHYLQKELQLFLAEKVEEMQFSFLS